MKKSIAKSVESGSSLIEILIALAIFATAIGGVLSFSSWVIGSVQTESAKSVRNVENMEMLKLLTQPIFFGAQSKYDENKDLRECLTIDAVECDTEKVYSLTPYDLTLEKPLYTASTSRDSSIENKVTFQVHCPNKQPKCDKAQYFTVNVKTYLSYHGLPLASVEKNGIVVPEFTDVVTFVPDVLPAPNRPINILLFLDNSNSMVFAKDQIKTALNNLIVKISGMDVTLGVYGLKTSPRTLSRRYILDADGNEQPLPPAPLPAGLVHYQATTYKAHYYSNYVDQDPLLFLTQTSTTRVFNFSSTDTPEFRTKKQLAVQNLVEGLYAVPTSEIDEPFCAILRMLETPGQNPPFKFDAFTPTVIFIISNENDETFLGRTLFGGCQKNYVTKWITESPEYYLGGYWGQLSLKVTANVKSDGAPTSPKQASFYVSPTSVPAPFILFSNCMAVASELSAGLIEDRLVHHFGGNVTYTRGDGYVIDSCHYTQTFNSLVKSAEPVSDSENICAQVDAHTYPISHDYANYINGSCKTGYYSGTGASSGSQISSEMLYPSTLSPTEAVYQSIKSKLNIENVYYMPITHPDATTCPMTEGSQVGTRYIELATKPDLKSTTIPICSPSFSGGLDSLKIWTDSFGANDIELPPTVAANLSGVEIIRGDTTISLTANSDYSISGTILIFKNGLLQPNDIIKVYLK